MIPELGFIALLFATLSALLLAVVPHIGIKRNNPVLMGLSWNFSYLFGIFCTISIGCLAYSFAVDDFSLEYVALHSNSQLPVFFKIAATWGGHEGSMLFWLFSLSLWLIAFALCSRKTDPIISARTLNILGVICLGFAIFILFFSNPFVRMFPAPFEGRDLNPMLQDVGLIFHPPLLYLGYVGFAVNFAMTIAALLSGHLDAALARWMRPWVLASWLFLTLGIALGSWWAYYELGWGGWWFWDPVENASLMPWLLAIALLHSLIATEQRGILRYWTILLSIFVFSLSILGTFIVRSGVLTSVHGFAVDNQRGAALLVLFFLLIVTALSIFAFKVNLVKTNARFALISKESAVLFVNVLFTISTISTFLGTFYPMLFSVLGWGSISVGAPYFNSIFLPLIIVLLLAMMIALAVNWQKIDRTLLTKRTLLLLPALVVAYVLVYMQIETDNSLKFNLSAFILLALSIWLLLATLWQNYFKLSIKRMGMLLAHSGVAITVLGAVMSGYFGSEIGVRMKPQQCETLSNYEFCYQGFRNELGPNYTAEKAIFHISHKGKPYTELYPERRYYDVRTMNMSEVGIEWGVLGDLYIVMGDRLGNGEFTFRLHYKPFVRWLWFGGVIMALGALSAMFGLYRENSGGNPKETKNES
ncbi:cytochrome c-type biogenesis protein NrfE [Cricetibacter osteomyelitidis]|uniref:Cytochrome c-type biogenesis protein NrfE n=1 Tax=Cricetibacter osteomyelitidis TaxID=1521931 RepID=A0A4R2SYC5_9PAST|nr:heme lyase NrfEFG subunit NrfE [Cricetibacter osteomyelitidis]TCP95539.1 cytochrome c-type biogenesis protein NrfE [Cricetibacter osteomyelitidis]